MAKFDIILVGATGYTGRITAKLLSKQTTCTWAIAGRSEAKLKELNKELHTNVRTFEVDVEKPETLDAVCQQAKCVISCAGPFTRCGMPVVDACVRNGVSYIDSTGEFNFVRQVIEKHHEEAKKQKIVLVSCCGFDSVPADVGNYVLHRDANEPVKSVECFYKMNTAGVSNGTVNSIAAVMSVIERKDLDPCSLNPPDAVKPLAARPRMFLWWNSRRGFTAPYGMAFINERIVRRTNALRGSHASYVEALEGNAKETMLATTFHWMFPFFAIGPLRRFLVNRFFPAISGVGPTEEQAKGRSYACTFEGTTDSNKSIKVEVSHNQDMYAVTGVYLIACARSVLKLTSQNALIPGALTPCAAFGDTLVTLLKDEGMRITTCM